MAIQIDSKATISSILEALKAEGVRTVDVAKAINGLSEKRLRSALKTAGYIFSNKAPKGWHYIADSEEPLNTSIFDYVNSSNTYVKSDETALDFSHTIHTQFTNNEIADLRIMLQEWGMKKASSQQAVTSPYSSIHERIKALPQDEKTRKTIVIDKGIGDRLDIYCKEERVNKSDILHLAIMDFLDKQ